MKRALFFLLLSSSALAQTQRHQLEAINRDVWLPFMAAYAKQDAQAFMDLHTSDLVRVPADERVIRTRDQYAAGVAQWFTSATAEGQRFSIAFRFSERIVTEGVASERGVYALRIESAKGEARTYYGRFHVIMKLAEGRWRIAVDYDSSEAGQVTATSFEQGIALDVFEPFVKAKE